MIDSTHASFASPSTGVPSRAGAAVTLAAALAAAAVVILAQPRLEMTSADANERQVLDEMVIFASLEEQMQGLVFCRVSPEVLANPLERIPVLRASDLRLWIEPRFLMRERHGYRFHFEGTPPRQSFELPVKEGFEDVTYVAAPIDPGRSGRRTFAYYSRAGHTIFSRADGRLPTPDDEAARTW